MAEALKAQLHEHLLRLGADAPEGVDAFMEAKSGFEVMYANWVEGRTRPIDWAKIEDPGDLQPYAQLPSPDEAGEGLGSLASKLAVLKLNGGLGTSMGCQGPKSAIEVRDGLTFLDIIVNQIRALNKCHSTDIPLVLMNSFNTHADTADILTKYEGVSVSFHTFNQSQYPRLLPDTKMPWMDTYDSQTHYWTPPGHGDVYASLARSGTLAKLKEEGKEYIFISNVDNLGATVDFSILKHMHDNDFNFIMEVTDKTESDKKGGTLIKYENKTKLLEIAQVPKPYVEEFKSIKKFKVFNTNNLWVRISAIEAALEQEGGLWDMDIIENGKDVNGTRVIQLECACGAAIQYFDNAVGVNVPRSRFLPVKTTSDLLLLQSNVYTLDLSTFNIYMHPSRALPYAPNITLGTAFRKVRDYVSRFRSMPCIRELSHLTVDGDVTFGRNVSLSGTVIIVAQDGSRIDIPDSCVLENKIVSGNLRILSH